MKLAGHLRRHLVAYLALAFALGGGSVYAAGKVGSGDFRTNAVKSRQLAPNALTAKQGVIRKKVQIDDPYSTGDLSFTTKTLLRYGPFKLTGSCRDLGSTTEMAYISSSKPGFASGLTSTPNYIGETPRQLAPSSGSLNSEAVNVHAVTAYTTSGQFLSVQIFEVNRVTGYSHASPDCSYWIIGRGHK